MIFSKPMNFSRFSINHQYLPWIFSSFIATTLLLLSIAIAIVICSFKKKPTISTSSNHIEDGSFIVNGKGNVNEEIKMELVDSKSDDVLQKDNESIQRNKKCFCLCCCCCCCNSKNDALKSFAEERFEFLSSSMNVVKVDLSENDRFASPAKVKYPSMEGIQNLSALCSDASEYDTNRPSHIDRELPPIPNNFLNQSNNQNFNNSIIEPEILSIKESKIYNELRPSDETDDDKKNLLSTKTSTMFKEHFENIPLSQTQYEKFQRSNVEFDKCCCDSQQDIRGSDDLSSNDYDPTYAAIKRKKPSCPVCGVPSVYTPAHSTRNSSLSLQLSSCLTSPIHNMNMKPLACDSLNNSTYASITKLPKAIPEISNNKDANSSGSSTIKRQRSISQGNIKKTSTLKGCEMQQSEIKIDNSSINSQTKSQSQNYSSFNTVSLWSLMISNRNSPHNMFPLVPDRTYGQSVIDLVAKLRESEQLKKSFGKSWFTLNDVGRSFTPPVLFSDSFNNSGSIINSKSRIWTPPSCQMIQGNVYTKSTLYSPQKAMDGNCSAYDFNFPDIIGSYRKLPLFQPKLTPPLSPMEYPSSEKDETYKFAIPNLSAANETLIRSESVFLEINDNNCINTVHQVPSVYEDLDFESGLAADKEIEVINKDLNVHLKDSMDYDYEYLLYPGQKKIKLLEYSDDSMISRTRPISIHLYGTETLGSHKSLKPYFEKCDIFGFSSLQMSPLMEQSIENSSSKTTLSSLSFHHFSRLISSEDSCAKSPPSAEPSPSLDNFEIPTESNAFLYNDLMWSKLNSAFDDYATLE